MSLKSIRQGLNQIAFGKDCKDCEALNVTCHDTGILDFAPANAGETVIYVGNNAVFRTKESIDQCDAKTGKLSNKLVANKIKKNAKEKNRFINLDDLKIGNN